MPAALAIAIKDVRQRVRDRSAIILAVIAPLALAYLFSVMLPGDASFSATWAVADLDGGPLAAGLREGPLAALAEDGLAVILPVADEAEALAAVDGGRADAAIVVPAGFSAAVGAGQEAQVRIIGDVDAVLATQVARAVVEGYASRVEAVQLAVATVLASAGGRADPARVSELARAAQAQPAPVALVREGLDVRVASNSTYYSAAMAVLFVFFAAQFGVVSLHAEKRNGTLARMLSAPIAPRAILLGKYLVSVVLGLLSMGILVVASSLLMGARWGDPLAVAALLVSIVLAASGVCLLVVGFSRNEEQAGGLVAIVAMVLAALGGSFFSLSQAPELLAQVSLLTPHAWFLRGIDSLAAGESIAVIVPSLVVLLLIAVISGGLGLARAGRVVLSR